MPTYTFTRTREQLASLVLRKVGVLASGETADPDDAEIVYEAIDLRLKEMHSKGVLWWNVSGAQSSLSLVSGTATVSAAADVLFPVTVALTISGEDKPLEIIGHREYQEIIDKTETGEPEKVFFSGGVYRFWPVPDANYTGKHTYEQIAADTASSTAPDVEVSMMRSLRNIIAYDVADDFGIPEGTIVRWAAEKEAALHTILALNQERVDPVVVAANYF